MSITIRRLIACLLIAFVPLQVTAASRMALCADISAAKFLPAESSTSVQVPCEQMTSKLTQDMPEVSSASHHHDGCWLGTICLAALILPPLPVAHASFCIERSRPLYFAQNKFFHSIAPDSPLRPPAAL